MVRNYSGPLVYATLAKARYEMKTYGEDMLEMTAETFRKRVIDLSELIMDKYVVEHEV